MPSNFASSVPGSATWSRGSQICHSTGRALLTDARAGLIWEARGTMDADADAQAVARETEEAGVSGWSPAFLSALAGLLSSYGHTATAAAARADAARPGSPVSALTLQGVIWAAGALATRETTTNKGSSTQNIHTGSPANYQIPADAQRPVVGSIPPMPTDLVTSGSSCGAPTAADLNQGNVTQLGVRTINPALLAILLGGGVLAGWLMLELLQRQQGVTSGRSTW